MAKQTTEIGTENVCKECGKKSNRMVAKPKNDGELSGWQESDNNVCLECYMKEWFEWQHKDWRTTENGQLNWC